MLKGVDAILKRRGKDIVRRFRDKMSSMKLDATRRTSKSFRYEVKPEELIIRYKKSFESIDAGLGPRFHSPSRGKIIEWMKAKNIQPRKNGQFVPSTDANYKRSAFAIGRAIYQNGTIKRFGYRGANIKAQVISPQYLGAITKELRKVIGFNISREISQNFKKHGFKSI